MSNARKCERFTSVVGLDTGISKSGLQMPPMDSSIRFAHVAQNSQAMTLTSPKRLRTEPKEPEGSLVRFCLASKKLAV